MPWRRHELLLAAGCLVLAGWLAYGLAQTTPGPSGPGVVVHNVTRAPIPATPEVAPGGVLPTSPMSSLTGH